MVTPSLNRLVISHSLRLYIFHSLHALHQPLTFFLVPACPVAYNLCSCHLLFLNPTTYHPLALFLSFIVFTPQPFPHLIVPIHSGSSVPNYFYSPQISRVLLFSMSKCEQPCNFPTARNLFSSSTLFHACHLA